MWDLNLVLFTPAIDIILVLILVYTGSYRMFEKFYKNKINKIFWLDFQIFVIMGVFFYLNYRGKEINFFDLFKLDWFLYFLVMSMFVESFFFAFYSERLGFGTLKKSGSFKLQNYNKNIEEEKDDKIEQKIKKLKLEKKEIEKEIKELQINSDNDVVTKKEIARLNYKILEIEEKIKQLF